MSWHKVFCRGVNAGQRGSGRDEGRHTLDSLIIVIFVICCRTTLMDYLQPVAGLSIRL